jgi:hypothetical protein
VIQTPGSAASPASGHLNRPTKDKCRTAAKYSNLSEQPRPCATADRQTSLRRHRRSWDIPMFCIQKASARPAGSELTTINVGSPEELVKAIASAELDEDLSDDT